jgi:hypothetical protein
MNCILPQTDIPALAVWISLWLNSKNGTFAAPINVGEPANSPKDDFAYLIDTKTRKVSYHRTVTADKVMTISTNSLETRKLVCEQTLSGIVTDLETGEVLANTKVTLFDDKFNKLKEVMSDDKGFYDMGTVECGKPYYVRAERALRDQEQKITISKTTGKTDLPIQLEKK